MGIIFFCLLLGAVALFLFYPKKVTCLLNGEVSFPSSVERDVSFDISVTVTNPTAETIYIDHVVLHSFLDAPTLLMGARVISTEPAMESEPIQLYPSDIQFSYFRKITPGETQRILFHMQAEKTGVYAGNIGIYTKDLECAFHYQNVEIEILPK